MVRKPSDAKVGSAGNGRPSRPDTDEIFGDKRSGRDRREGEQVSGDEVRRSNTERRKAGRASKTAWWLERDYVESHHFLQKSTGPRTRKRDGDTPDD
jgi:hypothetical protein